LLKTSKYGGEMMPLVNFLQMSAVMLKYYSLHSPHN